MKSLIITVARKPLDGTISDNAIEHGSGPIHIDASRIALNGSTKQATAGNRTVKDQKGWGVDMGGCDYEKGTGAVFTNEGRWPANMILVHKPGCKRVGFKRVKGSNPIGPNPGSNSGIVYGNYQGGQDGFDYVDTDGKETVDNWICVEGCPARDLDLQSAERGMHSAGFGRAPKPGKPNAQASIFGIGMSTEAQYRFGDSGGATRFYKQFEGEADE